MTAKKAETTKPETKATSSSTKMPGGVPKNFRQQADIESFYRFVNENDLRVEAVQIMRETRAHNGNQRLPNDPTKRLLSHQ